MYKYENYQSKKVKKKTKNLWIQIIKAHIQVFFSYLHAFRAQPFCTYYLTFQQFFLISRSKRDKLQELKFLALMLYSVHVYKYESYLPYHTTIFNRTLTKASNCCSTTSQTILDLSPLVGEPPFTTFYREKNIQISFRHDIMHVQIILECGMGVYIFWLGVVKLSVWVFAI